MNWIILLLAGLFEVSLTFCLGKARAASGLAFYLWGSGFLASTVLSMTLLAKAVQTLPLGTAYAIWTGIGAVGTVLIGIFVFKEPATPIRLFRSPEKACGCTILNSVIFRFFKKVTGNERIFITCKLYFIRRNVGMV